jgi:hypothetical protein
MTDSLNVIRLKSVVRALGPLADKVVFIGGVVAELLQVDRVLPAARATDDVDAVVALRSRGESDVFASSLRTLGFRDDVSAAHAHRWVAPDKTKVDLVPVNEMSIGFGNKWDLLATTSAETHQLDETSVRIVSAPLFLAMKWSAFNDRGGLDWMGSHDLEDILAVVATRPTIVEEVRNSNAEVRLYIATWCLKLLNEPAFAEIVQGALSTASLPGIGELAESRIELLADLSELRTETSG